MEIQEQTRLVETIIGLMQGMGVGDAFTTLISGIITLLHDHVAPAEGERLAREVADHIVTGYLASREAAQAYRRRLLN